MWHLLLGLYLSSCLTWRPMDIRHTKIRLEQEAVSVATQKWGPQIYFGHKVPELNPEFI